MVQVWLPSVRIEYVFAFQIWYCELRVKKPMKGRQKASFWFLLLFFLAFSQLNISWKLELTTFDFSLLTFESFKVSLPLFLTIEGKRWIDLSFSLPARFEQLNTAQKPGIFKFLFLFHFVIIFYSLFSRPLPSRLLFLSVLRDGVKKHLLEKCMICDVTLERRIIT